MLLKKRIKIEEELIQTNELIEELNKFRLTLEENLPLIKSIHDESNIFQYLYLQMLITVDKNMVMRLNQAIEQRMWDRTDDRFLTLIDKVEDFLTIEYLNSENIRESIRNLDKKARGFDGYVFGYWTVCDLIGSMKSPNIEDFHPEIKDYINSVVSK